MMGYVYLAAFEACGVVISERVFRRYGRMTRLWLGMTMGFILLMWLPTLYAFPMRFSMGAHCCALGTALVGAGLSLVEHPVALFRSLIARLTGQKAPDLPKSRVDMPVSDQHEPPVWLVLTVMVPLTLVMAYMQYTHTILPNGSGALMTGQSTYSDLNLHLSIATGVVNAQFPPDYNILPGTLLGYPFLMDAMSGSLYLLGMELRWSFIIPGVIMSALVFWGFVMLAWEMVKDWRAVLLASTLLFLNGGLGFIYVIDGAMGDPARFMEVFTGYYKAPANLIDENIRWVNILVDMLLPQRTFLSGWCVLIPALWLLMRCVREKDRKLFWILGAWAGTMPRIHAHCFMALGIISAVVMGCMLWQKRKKGCADTLINFLIYGGLAVLMALPQLIIWTFPQTVNGGGLTVNPFWVNQRNGRLIDEYFWFWLKNIGPVYLIMIPAAMAAPRGQKMFALGALGVWILAEIFQFQVNDYDNNKLFYVAFMIMLPMAARYLVTLYERIRDLPGRRIIAGAFLAVSLISGVLSVVRECLSEYELFGAKNVEATEYLAEYADPDTVVLAGTHHNNTVYALGGMKVVCGPGTFLYYHGLDYRTQESDVRKMFEDPAGNAALYEQYGVDFVYIGPHERADFAIDFDALNAAYPMIFDNGVTIYAVSEEAQAATGGTGDETAA